MSLRSQAWGSGTGLALVLTRLLRSVLYGVSPADPAMFAAVAMLLVGISLLATYIPARRATRVGPLVVLRTK